MRPWWLIVAGIGLLVAGLSILEARRPVIGSKESAVFHAINRLPDRLYWFLWPPMQLGNLAVGTIAGLVVALISRDLALGVGVLLAMVLKLVVERVVRREMADFLVLRQRPGTSQEGAILRGGDVPVSGPSFPSGHVILAAAVGCVVAPVVAVVWWWLPILVVATVMLGRVYVGAHNPLDVTAGLGAGLLAGGAVAVFVG
jgi:undecaprenyl-diphosphatase